MKRTKLLNRHLSALVASLGHLDEITIGDAGLPVPDGVAVIDLAVTANVPRFSDVIDALMSEMVIETAIIAHEADTALSETLANTVSRWAAAQGKLASLERLSHDDFKARSGRSKAVIRTGETTPYCNMILISGVSFLSA